MLRGITPTLKLISRMAPDKYWQIGQTLNRLEWSHLFWQSGVLTLELCYIVLETAYDAYIQNSEKIC